MVTRLVLESPTMAAKLIQFTMTVPAAITERFAAWMQDIGSNPDCIVGKPITLTLTKPDGEPYTDSTYHAQTYRAIAAMRDGEPWIARYPAVSCFSVRYIHKRTALVLVKRPLVAPVAPVASSKSDKSDK